jgi:hypothetical protein
VAIETQKRTDFPFVDEWRTESDRMGENVLNIPLFHDYNIVLPHISASSGVCTKTEGLFLTSPVLEIRRLKMSVGIAMTRHSWLLSPRPTKTSWKQRQNQRLDDHRGVAIVIER